MESDDSRIWAHLAGFLQLLLKRINGTWRAVLWRLRALCPGVNGHGQLVGQFQPGSARDCHSACPRHSAGPTALWHSWPCC